MSFKLATFILSAAAAVNAVVTPTAPSPGQSFNEGTNCNIQFDLDTTGTWTNMSVDLMTGNNFNMMLVTNVVSNMDGTTGTGSISWTCPAVTPNSAIYFYQFSNNGDPTTDTWTTRFTIAAADGSSTTPTNATQPSTGAAIPWGTGMLVDGTGTSGAVVTTGGSSAATGSSTGTGSLSMLTSTTASSSSRASSSTRTVAATSTTSSRASTTSASRTSSSSAAATSSTTAGVGSLTVNAVFGGAALLAAGGWMAL